MKQEKTITPHRQLTAFFSDTGLKTRGFRPIITAKDAGQLRRALELNIFDMSKFEQIILYYLADKNYKNLSPSIATMLSSTVLNSLIDKARNRAVFYKEIEQYADRYLNNKVEKKIDVYEEKEAKAVPMSDLLRKFAEKMQEKKTNSPRAPVAASGGINLFSNIN